MESYVAGKHEPNHLDRILAVPMFLVALLFLLVAGFLMHTEAIDFPETYHYSPAFRLFCLYVLLLLYFVFVCEAIVHKFAGSRNMRQHLWFLIFPFLRLCPRDHVDGRLAWVVGLGWCETTPHFEKYLARTFSGPMMLIALMVLPVVGAEMFWSQTIYSHPVWAWVIQTATGFIWMAFVFEFVVMFTVVEKKARYCKKNWIDLLVIALPLVAFLRAARLGRLLKLQQISRTARIYRMRGIVLRTWRAVVTLDVINMLLRRDPNFHIEKLESQILEKQEEIEYLKEELERIRKKVAGTDCQPSNNGLAANGPRKMLFSYWKK